MIFACFDLFNSHSGGPEAQLEERRLERATRRIRTDINGHKR